MYWRQALKRFFIGLTCLSLCLALPRGLRAEDPDKASELNTKAVEAYKAEKFMEAVDLWLQAVELGSLEQRIKLHRNLGSVLYRLERLPEAWYHMSSYLAQTEGGHEDVETAREQIEGKPAESHVRVLIITQPDGAQVTLPPGDRLHQVHSPVEWLFEPGRYEVEVAKDGHEAGHFELYVTRDGQKEFSFQLNPTHGMLRLVGGAEGCRVFVDEIHKGGLPYEESLPAGTHDVLVEFPEGGKWSSLESVDGGGSTEVVVPEAVVPVIGGPDIPPDPGPEQGSSQLWKWLVLGSGVVIIGVGGVFTALAYRGLGEYDDLKARWPDLASTTDHDYPDYLAEFDDVWPEHVQPHLTASYICYGVGAAAVAVGAAALIFLGDNEDVTISPLLAPGVAGFGLDVSF